jgi:2-polyprenyl-3-methyl-5-hydroxy-6-metoxy-1,4-benzoquinol methylase
MSTTTHDEHSGAVSIHLPRDLTTCEREPIYSSIAELLMDTVAGRMVSDVGCFVGVCSEPLNVEGHLRLLVILDIGKSCLPSFFKCCCS